MSGHEDTGLVIVLKAESRRTKKVGLCPFGFAANRLEALHAQRADLIERLTAAEAERDTYRRIIDRDRRSLARLVADLPPTPKPEQGEE